MWLTEQFEIKVRQLNLKHSILGKSLRNLEQSTRTDEANTDATSFVDDNSYGFVNEKF